MATEVSECTNEIVRSHQKSGLSNGSQYNPPGSPEEVLHPANVGPTTTHFTNCKGFKLHCSYWLPPENKIRAIAFLCHGFAEHLQWYEELALELNKENIFTFGHDHVGHGRSEGVRCDIRTVDEYIVDVINHCDEVKKQYPHLPFFIVGHSMGGMIAIRAAQCRPSLFRGCVLMGPLIKPDPNEATTFKIAAAKVCASMMPLMQVVRLKLNNVTRDDAMRLKISKDPLRYHGGLRARWTYACHNELLRIKSNMDSVSWPFLILHGEKDRLCDPDASLTFYNDALSKDKSIKIFPHAFHHLYLELPEVRREAISDTVVWIAKRLVPEEL